LPHNLNSAQAFIDMVRWFGFGFGLFLFFELVLVLVLAMV
jgi:hypothetical protein